MSRNYIDFISAYCDSWCERCAFTERCSHFAIKVAEEMCDGDVSAAIELAIGPARMPGREPQKPLEQRIAEAFENIELDDKELEEIGRGMDERRARVRADSLATTSHDYSVAAHRWLKRARECDPALEDALAIVHWDQFLIYVKICRALDGRDEYPDGAPFETSAVQSDWNGSAKVALLSIERSERAWRTIASALADEAAATLAGILAALRRDLLREFPRVMEFRRPGFDDPGSSGARQKLRQ